MKQASCCQLDLKVVPRASHDRIVGWLGTRLKVRVSAPPDKGRANAAVLALLADKLQVPAAALNIVRGHGTPLKTVSIPGLTHDTVRRRLSE